MKLETIEDYISDKHSEEELDLESKGQFLLGMGEYFESEEFDDEEVSISREVADILYETAYSISSYSELLDEYGTVNAYDTFYDSDPESFYLYGRLFARIYDKNPESIELFKKCDVPLIKHEDLHDPKKYYFINAIAEIDSGNAEPKDLKKLLTTDKIIYDGKENHSIEEAYEER